MGQGTGGDGSHTRAGRAARYCETLIRRVRLLDRRDDAWFHRAASEVVPGEPPARCIDRVDVDRIDAGNRLPALRILAV